MSIFYSMLIVFIILWLSTYVISFLYRLKINEGKYTYNFLDFIKQKNYKYCSSDAFIIASIGTIIIFSL